MARDYMGDGGWAEVGMDDVRACDGESGIAGGGRGMGIVMVIDAEAVGIAEEGREEGP